MTQWKKLTPEEAFDRFNGMVKEIYMTALPGADSEIKRLLDVLGQITQKKFILELKARSLKNFMDLVVSKTNHGGETLGIKISKPRSITLVDSL